MQDIRRWFKRQGSKDGEDKAALVSEPAKPAVAASSPAAAKSGTKKTATPSQKDSSRQYSSPVLKKSTHAKPEPTAERKGSPAKQPTLSKRAAASKKTKEEGEDEYVAEEADEDKDEDGEWEGDEEEEEDKPASKRAKVGATGVGRGRGRGSAGLPTPAAETLAKTPAKTPAASKAPEMAGKPAGGRGRGGWGRGAFMGERAPPPHKGEKEVPQGPEDALAGLTFVISGTLDSLEREEAEDLIKSHGGRVTGSVSKKTSYLLADEDVGGNKSKKAKELGVPFLNEDGLFDLIRAKAGAPAANKTTPPPPPPIATNQEAAAKAKGKRAAPEPPTAPPPATKKPAPRGAAAPAGVQLEAWPQKYAPRRSDEIVGNPSLVKQLREWLLSWHEVHQPPPAGGRKGKKGGGGAGGRSGGAKKAVLLSGPPGIGKTTTARVIAQELGFSIMEVNASDSRGKADAKVANGMGGKTANTVKEMVSNESLTMGPAGRSKAVLIMDEVDGMSGGDRGGVADLIASIRVSRIPIVCICNDRYARQLQSLTGYCLLLNYRKPTKQQMAKRLRHIATQEKLQVPEMALEELAERVNGDMRMALNQLQYMALISRHMSYGDLRTRLQASAKDEDLRPMAAVDKLLGMGADKLRLDERLDAALSDIDLVPLMVQENYLNYRPQAAGADPEGVECMDRAARAAEAVAEGDRVNVVVRRYQRWQHLPFGAVMSCVIPGALMRGQRYTLTQGEMNFNRFPGWLGKNSTAGKNWRLLEDLHTHILASRICEPTRSAVRLDYLHVLGDRLTTPLKTLPKEAAVEEVASLMEEYSLTLDDYETAVALLRFKGFPDLTEGIASAVKGHLTKEYKKRQHKVKSADLLPEFLAPGQKKGSGKKKITARLAAAMEPVGMADADVPVAIEEAAAAEAEAEEGEGEGEGEGEDEGRAGEASNGPNGTSLAGGPSNAGGSASKGRSGAANRGTAGGGGAGAKGEDEGKSERGWS